MQNEMKNFMGDLIWEIQERYNESLLVPEGENSEDRAFRNGSNFSYWCVLSLIESELIAFGFDEDKIGHIVPMLGEGEIDPASHRFWPAD
jgi:hypothetical protein